METGRGTKEGNKSLSYASKSLSNLGQVDNIRAEGHFQFPNGDQYNGQFLAFRAPLSIFRDGAGTYTCKDESLYKGKWTRDILDELDEIVFPDKSKFVGSLENMICEGRGAYTFNEGIEVAGILSNNHFVGDMELTDPNGHCWFAKNPMNDCEVFFYPKEPFYESVLMSGPSGEETGRDEGDQSNV